MKGRIVRGGWIARDGGEERRGMTVGKIVSRKKGIQKEMKRHEEKNKKRRKRRWKVRIMKA